jgi:tRNA 2-thiouridine synthesizing protein A
MPVMVEKQRVDATLDCRGFTCPGPIFMISDKIKSLKPGQILKVYADDPAAEEDVKSWVRRVGHELLQIEKTGSEMEFYIKKKDEIG